MEEAALRCPCPCTPERRLCSEKPRGFGADPTSGGSWGRQGEQALLLKGARGFRAAELAGTRLRWAQMTISQGLISAPVIRINTPLPGEALPARTTGFVSRAEPFLSQSLPPTPDSHLNYFLYILQCFSSCTHKKMVLFVRIFIAKGRN